MRGRVIAEKYELVDLLGRGGMGSVWRAIDKSLEREVAIKVMADRHLRSATSRERFKREARALARLRSPQVVQIHDYGVEDSSPYIVMELLAGESLEARLGRTGPISPKEFLPLMRQITEGLSAAAALDMVHRDLKPENVFIVNEGSRRDQVKLLDFGLAWMHARGESREPLETNIVGTPSYMSPEALRGSIPALGHDLWSASVIAYRALTGRLPFKERYLGKLIVSICTDPAPPPSTRVPSLGPDIDGFFARALAKDPSRRFDTPAELLQGFIAALGLDEAVKVLVVDDEPDMQELIRLRFARQIRARRYQFEFALNGVEALEQLRRHSDIAVVLADINMPQMDGLTLLTKIPELAPHARTIMVSAYSNMGNIRQAMNSGAFDFVVKPIDFGDLQATIEKTARAVETQRQLEARDQENAALRRLISPAMLERITNLGPGALHTPETIEASVLALRLLGSPAAPEGSAPASQLRPYNALFEVLVPEIERSGAKVIRFDTRGVLTYVAGHAHVQRALKLARRSMSSLAKLARIAGPDTPYAEAIGIGVAAGPLTLGCLGSHTCGRLSFVAIGASCEQAAQLAREAQPGEVLVSQALSEAAGLSPFINPHPSPERAHKTVFEWRLAEPPEDEQEDSFSTRTLSGHPTEAVAGLQALEEDELLFGWTLSEI